MKNLLVLFTLMIVPIAGQNLPISWSQSYCTYDLAKTHAPGHYSLGFSINNFCIYSPEGDTIAYDERRFDIFANLGLFKKTEIEVKYSYPTAGVLAIKYQFVEKYLPTAFKLGFGYMKGTRTGYVTDYVFDFYPTVVLSKNISRRLQCFIAPKIIYSLHTRDRQEHSHREPTHVFQYGFGVGLAIGDGFTILPESNWLFGSVSDVHYIVHQFGLGLNLVIH